MKVRLGFIAALAWAIGLSAIVWAWNVAHQVRVSVTSHSPTPALPSTPVLSPAPPLTPAPSPSSLYALIQLDPKPGKPLLPVTPLPPHGVPPWSAPQVDFGPHVRTVAYFPDFKVDGAYEAADGLLYVTYYWTAADWNDADNRFHRSIGVLTAGAIRQMFDIFDGGIGIDAEDGGDPHVFIHYDDPMDDPTFPPAMYIATPAGLFISSMPPASGPTASPTPCHPFGVGSLCDASDGVSYSEHGAVVARLPGARIIGGGPGRFLAAKNIPSAGQDEYIEGFALETAEQR